MRFRLRLFLMAVLIGAASLSQAQWVVTDPANLVQNSLTAVRTMEQIQNQVSQLQNDAQMLVNQSRNLASLPFNGLHRIRATLAGSQRLIAQAQGLALEVQRMNQQFAAQYPAQYHAAISSDQMARHAHQRWQNSLNGLQSAMQLQAQLAQDVMADEEVLSDLVGQSQAATGALQAAQATNQLLALQTKQTIQLQQLQLIQGRATALEQARQVAAIERGREVTRRFLGTGTPYTPRSVHFYPGIQGRP